MACPYFFPTEKSSSILWAFPQRLPLGAGFCGSCTAQGGHRIPTETELRDFCNLGYASHCENLPTDRRADSIRFSVAPLTSVNKASSVNSVNSVNKDIKNNHHAEDHIRLHYSCERNHAPVEHGVLEYDCGTRSWQVTHNDPCIQRQAECYVQMYLERRRIG